MAWLTGVNKVEERVSMQAASALRVSRWDLVLAIMMVAVGLTLSVQWQSEPAVPAPPTASRGEISPQTIQHLEQRQKELKAEVSSLQNQVHTYQEYATARRDTLSGLTSEIERQQIIAGLVPLTGVGVKVVLDDSTLNPPPTEDATNYIIHDYELRDVVNSLWQSGAEAIAINGERIVGVTSIYCVGSTIMVNATRLSPPYEIVAIGDGEQMSDFLNQATTLRKLKSSAAKYGIQLKLDRASDLKVPAYNGGYSIKHATIGSDAQ